MSDITQPAWNQRVRFVDVFGCFVASYCVTAAQ